jgi:hypothetical protein
VLLLPGHECAIATRTATIASSSPAQAATVATLGHFTAASVALVRSTAAIGSYGTAQASTWLAARLLAAGEFSGLGANFHATVYMSRRTMMNSSSERPAPPVRS